MRPVARSTAPVGLSARSKFTAVASHCAGVIWQATVRAQIRL
jgi:hypothetical protein